MNKIVVTKTLVLAFAFCLLGATAAFGQASVLISNPQPTVFNDHPQHAMQHDMGVESNLFVSNPYSYAQGEQPLSEFATAKQEVPLGDVARAYRKDHSISRKSTIRLEKQAD
jgi:hypothetical protein